MLSSSTSDSDSEDTKDLLIVEEVDKGARRLAPVTFVDEKEEVTYDYTSTSTSTEISSVPGGS